MGPPMTFAIDGKQYIALMGGSGGTAESRRTTNPGAITSQMKPQLLVFGLDGKAELPSSSATPPQISADPHQ